MYILSTRAYLGFMPLDWRQCSIPNSGINSNFPTAGPSSPHPLETLHSIICLNYNVYEFPPHIITASIIPFQRQENPLSLKSPRNQGEFISLESQTPHFQSPSWLTPFPYPLPQCSKLAQQPELLNQKLICKENNEKNNPVSEGFQWGVPLEYRTR